MEFDENDAVKYIREHIDPTVAALYDDNEYLNLIDIIFDYYEANGLLDLDIDEDDETDEDVDTDELTEYAARMIRRDKGARLAPEHLRPMIEAYMDYENSLD